MAKRKLYISLVLTLTFLGFCSCSKDSVLPVVTQDGDPQNYFVAVTDSSLFTTIDDLVYYIAQSNGDELGLSTYILEALYSGQIYEIAKRNYIDVGITPEGDWKLQFERYNFTYNSVDVNGKPIVLSGAVIFPNNVPGTSRNYELDNITLFSPYHVAKNSSCVTMSGSPAMLRVLFNSMVVIPDTQGYGASYGTRQPYFESAATARQAIDCELAAIELANMHKVGMCKTYGTYNIGSSLGAMTTMAVQKLLETTEPLAVRSLIRLKSSFCSCAPLDLNAVLKYHASNLIITNPMLLALVMNSVYYSNQNVFEGYTIENFMSNDFNMTHVRLGGVDYSLMSMMESLKYDALTINAEYLLNGLVSASTILSDSVYRGFAEGRDNKLCNLIKQINDANNPALGWTPETDILIEHSQNDDYIPYSSTFGAYEKLKYGKSGAENPKVNFNTLYVPTHIAACVEGMLTVLFTKDPVSGE